LAQQQKHEEAEAYALKRSLERSSLCEEARASALKRKMGMGPGFVHLAAPMVIDSSGIVHLARRSH